MRIRLACVWLFVWGGGCFGHEPRIACASLIQLTSGSDVEVLVRQLQEQFSLEHRGAEHRAELDTSHLFPGFWGTYLFYNVAQDGTHFFFNTNEAGESVWSWENLQDEWVKFFLLSTTQYTNRLADAAFREKEPLRLLKARIGVFKRGKQYDVAGSERVHMDGWVSAESQTHARIYIRFFIVLLGDGILRLNDEQQADSQLLQSILAGQPDNDADLNRSILAKMVPIDRGMFFVMSNVGRVVLNSGAVVGTPHASQSKDGVFNRDRVVMALDYGREDLLP